MDDPRQAATIAQVGGSGRREGQGEERQRQREGQGEERQRVRPGTKSTSIAPKRIQCIPIPDYWEQAHGAPDDPYWTWQC